MVETRPGARALMACLGDGSRFRLVRALIGGARCVTDLAGEVGLSQSCTTRHLQVLERRRVVTGTRDGKRVLYRIRDDEPALLPLLEWALDAEVEKPAHPGGGRREPGSDGRAGARAGARQAAGGRAQRPTATATTPPAGPPRGRTADAQGAPLPESRRRAEPEPAAAPALAPAQAPAQEPAPEPAAAPVTTRRRTHSDIEDFLL